VFERHFSRFYNAVNSGRTCIYFGKLFKNDLLHLCNPDLINEVISDGFDSGMSFYFSLNSNS
jgi:hypothetical protein